MSLINTIGLSLRDCDCITTVKQVDFATLNLSKSGLYVDNTEFTTPLKDDVFVNCGDSGIWETLAESRAEALETLNLKLLTEVGNYQSKKFGNIADKFGQKETYAVNLNSLYGQFLGFSVKPKSPRGSVLKVNSLSLAIAEAGTYNVKLIKVDPNTLEQEELFAQDVVGGSNALSTVTVDWVYRFVGDETLYFGYNRANGFPLNTKTYCPTCNGSKPYYTKQLDVKGFDSTSQATMTTETLRTSSYTYGLYVDFNYQCDYLGWMEDRADSFFQDKPFGKLYAKILQMLSCFYFNNKILQSGVSYYTLVEGNRLVEINSEIQEIVSELVPNLAVMLPSDFVDCFNCKPKHSVQVRTLQI